jgi:hypothetical protein
MAAAQLASEFDGGQASDEQTQTPHLHETREKTLKAELLDKPPALSRFEAAHREGQCLHGSKHSHFLLAAIPKLIVH